ncbi:DUF4244 domain-containing protein [Arthrobacter sp. BB-1]|uniref:DUF4244 domain-containing protein n=1 Tax=unclassified Arthrobacter TaxID=235627 RepID=UPI0010ECEB1D|nr:MULTISPECIES: DUF4244 domain-containing protein [unclassified Arthrobacter]TNB70151.1 DUF4244 domain-containing protein [Arthrobacter sp. BB-1]VII97608.1 hypothetical protein [Arthrobacter sp. DR-2P]
MSTHYRRHYADGSAALAAGRSAAREHRTSTLPANLVELYPGLKAPSSPNRGTRLLGSEAGMATAEYAIATLAAVGFAGLLVFILRSEEVRGFLLTLIRTALALP